MPDYTVNNLLVQDVAGVNAALQPVTLKRVSFRVGTRGPFTCDFRPGEYTADAVIAAVNKEIETLRAIDAGVAPAT